MSDYFLSASVENVTEVEHDVCSKLFNIKDYYFEHGRTSYFTLCRARQAKM